MDRLNKIGMSHSDPAAGKILGLMFKHRPSLRRGHVTCYMLHADTRHTRGNADTQYHSQQYFCLYAEYAIAPLALA